MAMTRHEEQTAEEDAGGRDPRAFTPSLPMVLLRAREAVMRYFRPILRGQDLTEQQWRVLRVLEQGGRMEVLELARTTLLRPPSLSRIIPKMEQRGLVRREADARDLRRTLVAIEPEGLALLKRIWPLAEAAYAEIEARFGAENLRRLVAVNAALEEALAGPGAPAEEGEGAGDEAEA